MITRLAKHGNRLVLILDPGLLDLLKIGVNTPLAVTTDGTRLVVMKAADPQCERTFRAAVRKVGRRFGRAFERLAD